MNKGVLLFAHNNREVDYARMSIISGGLAKKHLGVSVSLATDESTVSWMKESGIYHKAESLFESIILIDRPEISNYRRLHDGESEIKTPFINQNRSSVWDITPYDRTLLIDCDYFIMSDILNEYWDVDQDVLIGDSIQDIHSEDRMNYLDKYISYTGMKMRWATTCMFTKNKRSKLFFDLIQDIRDNYSLYGSVYRFTDIQYRNDIAFSVANHILNGFNTVKEYTLPPVLTALDKDVLHKVEHDKLYFLINSNLSQKYYAVSNKSRDIHVMNKKSVVRNFDALLELI